MKARVVSGGIVSVTIAILGVAASVAYATSPDGARRMSTEFAGIAGLHEVVGEQQYNAVRRKQASANCGRGEVVVSGGYILAGPFQTVGSPAPKALPVVTESTPARRQDGPPDTWSVWAIAPRDFSGPWGLTPKAICAKGR